MDPDPKVAQRGPYVRDEKAGKFAWCSCGQSQNQPYCDGSHKRAGLFRPLKIVLEEDQRVEWCGCKHTMTPPFCDGSHEDCA